MVYGIDRVDEGGPGQPDPTKLDEAIWLSWLGLGWLGLRCLGGFRDFVSMCCVCFFKSPLGMVGPPTLNWDPNRPRYGIGETASNAKRCPNIE